MRRGWLCVLALAMTVFGGLHAATAQPTNPANRAPKTVKITLVHLNDVYEILPVEGGKSGGLLRLV